MTGREAILEYLKTHDDFSPMEVVKTCGFTLNCISTNARKMVDGKELYVSSRKWRTIRYKARKSEGKPEDEYDIFSQCKASPVMKRMLAFYGRSL
ncbi:protein ren [Kosakonia sp. ML.JS2a]|uniref:protein ren n=1 Tax=Kosakonia sp. ML.JS2a TaxID=2980557 RepID=UPI0021D803F6|nr:protein ren [Kosakonia sp. ML.JS2a]UXY09007.1 protein ren [Kosakonia sp. ML.JS2a]